MSKIYKLNSNTNSKELLKSIGVESGGISIMKKKGEVFKIFIKDLNVAGANILKQDALSIGAEVATPRGCINCESKFVDVVLFANSKQLEILSKKELAQPFGLKNIAKELNKFINLKSFNREIMGILNINSDSFYAKSRILEQEIIINCEKLINDGADIIDIGAVSSRPNSDFVTEDEEFKRLQNIIDLIYSNKLYEKVKFSLDSYSPRVIDYALNRGFKIINDISGIQDLAIAKLAKDYNATLVIMHMQNSPKTMQINPTYENVIVDIDEFFTQKLEIAYKFDIKDIVLDVGIGFGKSLEHNLLLIKHLSHFTHFGYRLLIGVSRKSLIDKISPSEVDLRLGGTINLSMEAIRNGASIIRVHDVYEHKQALLTLQALENTTI